jgi:hypothetical protein
LPSLPLSHITGTLQKASFSNPIPFSSTYLQPTHHISQSCINTPACYSVNHLHRVSPFQLHPESHPSRCVPVLPQRPWQPLSLRSFLKLPPPSPSLCLPLPQLASIPRQFRKCRDVDSSSLTRSSQQTDWYSSMVLGPKKRLSTDLRRHYPYKRLYRGTLDFSDLVAPAASFIFICRHQRVPIAVCPFSSCP